MKEEVLNRRLVFGGSLLNLALIVLLWMVIMAVSPALQVAVHARGLLELDLPFVSNYYLRVFRFAHLLPPLAFLFVGIQWKASKPVWRLIGVAGMMFLLVCAVLLLVWAFIAAAMPNMLLCSEFGLAFWEKDCTL